MEQVKQNQQSNSEDSQPSTEFVANPQQAIVERTAEKAEEKKKATATMPSLDLPVLSAKKANISNTYVPPASSSRQQVTSPTAAASALSTATNPVSSGDKSYTFACGKGNYPNHLIKALQARGNWTQLSEDVAIEQSNFYWRQTNLSYQSYHDVDIRINSDSLKPLFINHFENTRGITTKTGLISSLQQYYQHSEAAVRASYTVFDTTPTTFIISRVSDDDEMHLLMNRYKEIARGGSRKERVPVKHCEQNMWLVKPASLNQGRGIEIFRNLRDINECIFHKNPQTRSWVVQKYVEHPFLFNGRKFDIRVWAVVTDDFRIYFYKHGYLRTSSAEYDLKDKNNYVHLTNQCLQVKGEGYAQHEEGNTLFYDDLQKYLDENFGEHNLNFEEHFIPRMKDIIIDSFLCVKKKMNPNHRTNVFELFGFDFLLDEDFRIWLIEVNYNPFLGTPNEQMKIIVPNLITDMLKIVLDPVIPPKNEDQPERENDFELIYRDASQKHGPAVNVRRPFSFELVYPIPSLKPMIGVKRVVRESLPKAQFLKKNAGDLRLQNMKAQTAVRPLDDSVALDYSTAAAGSMISPRKDLMQGAKTPGRSKSLNPSKHIFQMRKKTRAGSNSTSNNNSQSQERTATSVSSVGGRSKLQMTAKRKKNGESGIIEQVEEEDKMSNDYDSAEGDEATCNTIKAKPKNLLCKNLLDQTKELCYQHSPVYKDFDQIFTRIMSRFQDWEIHEDKEIVMACQSLKVVANSGQIVNLVQEKNMKRVIAIYESEDLHMKFRQEISELFLIIAKNIGLRKIFLNKNLHEILVRNSLSFLDQKPTVKVSAQMLEVFQNAIKLLCMVCTARKTQYYIPGETNLSERVRKRAFDSGTFTLLQYLFTELKDETENPFKAIRNHIQQQILNYETMTDLIYHSRLLTFLKENPQLAMSISQLRLNVESAMEETKDLSSSALADTELTNESALNETHEMTNLTSPKGKYASNIMPNYQTSPRLGTSKGRSVKKTNSSMINFNSQSHASGTLGQIIAGQPAASAANQQNERSKQLYEVDTEKLLLSNDKVTITDLWKSNPQPMFPAFFLKLLDLDAALNEANLKTENLRLRIDKRKLNEEKFKEEKIAKAAQEKADQMEQRRLRIEQQERKKEAQRKFAEELKRRAEQNAQLKAQQQKEDQQQHQQSSAAAATTYNQYYAYAQQQKLPPLVNINQHHSQVQRQAQQQSTKHQLSIEHQSQISSKESVGSSSLPKPSPAASVSSASHHNHSNSFHGVIVTKTSKKVVQGFKTPTIPKHQICVTTSSPTASQNPTQNQILTQKNSQTQPQRIKKLLESSSPMANINLMNYNNGQSNREVRVISPDYNLNDNSKNTQDIAQNAVTNNNRVVKLVQQFYENRRHQAGDHNSSHQSQSITTTINHNLMPTDSSIVALSPKLPPQRRNSSSTQTHQLQQLNQKAYARLRKSKHTHSMTSSQDTKKMMVLQQDQAQSPIAVLDAMMQKRPSLDHSGLIRDMQTRRMSKMQTPLLIPINSAIPNIITGGEHDISLVSPMQIGTQQQQITTYNVTPTTQMILTDAQTLIYHTGENANRLSRAHQISMGTNSTKARGTGHTSGLHDRKKSVNRRDGKSSNLKEQFADRSPYVSQETAALLKRHLARRGINNNGSIRSMHTASANNLPSPVKVVVQDMINSIVSREPGVFVEGSKRLRRNSKLARLTSQKKHSNVGGGRGSPTAILRQLSITKNFVNGNREKMTEEAAYNSPHKSDGENSYENDSFIALASPIICKKTSSRLEQEQQ